MKLGWILAEVSMVGPNLDDPIKIQEVQQKQGRQLVFLFLLKWMEWTTTSKKIFISGFRLKNEVINFEPSNPIK